MPTRRDSRSSARVPPDHPDRTWADHFDLSRRDSLKLGGAIAATLSAGCQTIGLGSAPDPPPHDVHLGEEGLENGDRIDEYFFEYFGGGETVFVPGGTYEWDGTGLDQPAANSEIVTNGSHRVTFELTDGATYEDRFYEPGITISGFTIRGVAPASSKNGWDIQCNEEGGEIVFEDLRMPDGCRGEGRCFYLPEEGHAGRGVVRNCLMAKFSSDTIYTDTGSMTVENCVFIDNNISMIRVGRGTNYVRNNLLLFEGDTRPAENGGIAVRGIRVREPGTTYIEGCDLVWTHGTEDAEQRADNPIELHEGAEGATGIVRDTRIYNETGYPSVGNALGDAFEFRNVHLTGPGVRPPSGVTEGVVVGNDAEEPRDDYSYDDPASFSGGPLDDVEPFETPYPPVTLGTVAGLRTKLELLAPDDNPDGEFTVTFTVDGTLARGDDTEPDRDTIVENDDGTLTATSADLHEDNDTWYYTGEIVDYSFDPDAEEYSVYVFVDGRVRSFDELVA